MLRRTQSIQLRPDDDYDDGIEVEEIEMASLANPRADRRHVEQWLSEVQRATEMPRTEKRGLDALRSEFQRTLVSNGDSTPDGATISGFWRQLLRPSRLILLLVAVLAAGAALFVAMQEAPPPAVQEAVVAEPVVQVVEEPKVPVLAAREPIAIGQRITASSVEWIEWPEAVARPEFITETAMPDALERMQGSIARQEFLAGEPIRADKLIEGQGYLSAVLPEGSRAVSIMVTPESASGGFILPNDHVDVVLTRNAAAGGVQLSTTILADVEVLAIGGQLGRTAEADAGAEEATGDAETAQGFGDQTVATLALKPREAEILASAVGAGRLSLVLRPLLENGMGGEVATGMSRNDQIRMTSPFWAN